MDVPVWSKYKSRFGVLRQFETHSILPVYSQLCAYGQLRTQTNIYAWLHVSKNISEIFIFISRVNSLVGILSVFQNKIKNCNILCM